MKYIRELRGRKRADEPLICKICRNKAFTANATLLYHYRSHAGWTHIDRIMTRNCTAVVVVTVVVVTVVVVIICSLICKICRNKAFTANATLLYHYCNHAG